MPEAAKRISHVVVTGGVQRALGERPWSGPRSENSGYRNDRSTAAHGER